jgi:hypothetical protein
MNIYLNKNTTYYKIVDHFELYDFRINFIFIPWSSFEFKNFNINIYLNKNLMYYKIVDLFELYVV